MHHSIIVDLVNHNTVVFKYKTEKKYLKKKIKKKEDKYSDKQMCEHYCISSDIIKSLT